MYFGPSHVCKLFLFTDADLAPALKGYYEEGAGRYYAPDDTIDVRMQYASHKYVNLLC